MFWKRFSNIPDIIVNMKEYCDLEDNNQLPEREWEVSLGSHPKQNGLWFNIGLLFDIDYQSISLPLFGASNYFTKINEKLSDSKSQLLKYWNIHYTFFCFEQKIFRTNKAFEIQLSKLQGLRTGFELSKTAKQDHPSIELNLYILGFNLILYFFDIRHWNYNEHRFYYNDEPQYNVNKKEFLLQLKKYVASHPELDKGYLNRNANNIQIQ